MRAEIKEHVDNIMDCMTGADGGIGFMKLKMLLEYLDEQAQDGDEDSNKALECVVRFSKLITFAKKE